MIMTIVEVNKAKCLVICLRGKLISILGSGTDEMSAEGSVGVVNENARGGNKVGDVFVTVVEIEESVEKLAKDKGAGGDGLGGIG